MKCSSLQKIIYIMGTARSATTILEIILSDNQGITGVGEITHIFRDGVIRNDYCACGKKAKECMIWGKIFSENNFVKIVSQRYQKLFTKLDWHLGIARKAFGLIKKEDTAIYKNINSRLFTSVCNLTGCPVIVDSSKYAARAISLSRAFPGKVKVICLTRSPIGLIKAFKRTDAAEQRPKSLASTVLYYMVVLFCCRIAIKAVGRQHCTIITYEQLLKNPDSTLESIEKNSEISLRQSRQKVADSDHFSIGHIVTGNRLRKAGKIRFKPNFSVYQPEGFREAIAEQAMLWFGRFLGFKY